MEDIMVCKFTIEMLKPINTKNHTIFIVTKEKKYYEIEIILDYKQTNTGYNYLIKWKNYS
jgi:hypothetical protein